MDWLTLLRQEVDATSITATAAKIGYSRPSISLALAGRYPGGTAKISAAVLSKLQVVDCPYLGRQIKGAECKDNALRPMPTGNPQELNFWRACQRCPHSPKGQNHAV